MVITSPFTNIKGFVATRPPLVLFTLCLIAFAVTTFTFGYYVEHREDLPNIDAHRDWVSFLSYLSDRKLCLVRSNVTTIQSNFLSVNKSQNVNIDTVSVQAHLTMDVSGHNVSFVYGNISTQDWMSDCPMTTSVRHVEISYSVPHVNMSMINIEPVPVCVSIRGPMELIEPASKEKECDEHITYHSAWEIRNSVSELCPHGISASLRYEPSKHNAKMLSLRDTSIIHLHLFHTSYFLLVMAITIICYAMIKGKPVVKHQPLDKAPMEA